MYLKRAAGLTFVLLMVLATTALGSPAPQSNNQYAIERAQAAVREQIIRERGTNLDISFPDWQRAETYYISNAETGVRGEGTYAWRNDYRRTERFSYDAIVNVRSGRVDRVSYRTLGATGTESRWPDNDRYDRYNVPNWLVGTYTGRSPSNNRRNATLTIGRSGNVTVTNERGRVDSGQYANGQIDFNDNFSWTIDRNGNDIRVRDTRTNRSERFRRTSDWNDNYDGNVPQWAIGTFRGNTDSGESELTIGPEGSASIRSLRTNQVFYGRYELGILNFEFGSFNVTRNGDGIRTIERGNRRNQTSYSRVD